MKTILESQKLSIAQCRSILNVNGNKYTDAEILKIRDWFYRYAELTLEFLQGKTQTDLKEIEKRIKEKNRNKNNGKNENE